MVNSILNLPLFIGQYGEEIRDLAPDMVAALLKAFHGYANAGSEDDEAAFSACQVNTHPSVTTNSLTFTLHMPGIHPNNRH